MKTCFCSITGITYCNFSSLKETSSILCFPSQIKVTGLLNINSTEGKTKCVLVVVDKIANCFYLNEYLVGHGFTIKQNKNIFCGTLGCF